MAIILAESVVITKSRLTKGFNGDNINFNGKVLTAEEADKGFKAAGSVKPPYISVLASGNQKGFSAGAANAFNDYVNDINFNKYNAEPVINRLFDDMDAVVEKCAIENSRLSMGIICAYEDCVVAAKMGGCHLLRFSEGELFEIALSDDEKGRGYQFIDSVADGDIFALVGEEVSENLDYDAIVKIFDSGKELKEMIRDFFKLLALSAGKDCSVSLVKLKSDTERTYAAVPDVSFTDDIGDDSEGIPEQLHEFDAQPAINETELKENNTEISDEEMPETGKSPAMKKKIISFIPIAVLVIILAVTTALYLSTRPDNKKPVENPSDNNNAPVINLEDDTALGDDFNGSNGMQEVDDTEFGGNVSGVPADETTTAEETTTSEPETERPTRAPETEGTTAERETSGDSEETTVSDSETTTLSSDETTVNNDDPEAPVDPENPEDPEDPVDPENPEDPEVPEDPEDPETPEEPENADTPEEPEVLPETPEADAGEEGAEG